MAGLRGGPPAGELAGGLTSQVVSYFAAPFAAASITSATSLG